MTDLLRDTPAGSVSAETAVPSFVSGRIFILLAATGLAVGAIATLPLLGVSSYLLTLIYYTAYYATLAQSWNLISGLTGYLSFAHGALAGIGTYALFIANGRGLPLGASFLLAVTAATAGSFLIGLPSLRIRGVAFAFATLFFQEISSLLVIRGGSLTGGAAGLVLEDLVPLWVPYVLMLFLAWSSTWAVATLRRSHLGLRVLAIREDELAAAIAGVPATRYKLVLFCCSATVAGAVGATHGLFAGSIYPQIVFSVDTSVAAIAVTLIGGIGFAAGPVVGALLFVILREVLQVFVPGLHLAALGAVVVLVVLFLPGGLVGALGKLRSGQSGGGS